MLASQSPWGPDGSATFIDNPIGFGHTALYNSPLASAEQLPQKIDTSSSIITAAVRIDNRSELFDQLKIPQNQRSTISDSHLILHAYQKWNQDCPKYMLGDFAFAIWDPQEQSLLLARDQHGATALYYYDCARFFAFASSLTALLVLPEIPKKLNESRLGQSMLYILGDADQTCFQSINHLLSAHTLKVNWEGIKIQRYWDPMSVPELQYENELDYAENLRIILDQAVRCRLRNYRQVGLALSSGLDSTAVAALAAPALKEDGRRLQAYCWVPAYDQQKPHGSRLLNEQPLVQKVVDTVGNIDIQYIDSRNIGLVDAINITLDHHPGIGFSPTNMHWLHQLFTLANDQGVSALLNGRAGNSTISWSGLASSVKLLDLLRQRQWKKALLHKGLYPLFPGSYRHRKMALLQKTIIGDRGINPTFAARVGLLEQFREQDNPAIFKDWHDSRRARAAILLPSANVLDAMMAEICGPYGLEWRDPTADVRVIEYTFAVPDHLFSGKSGNERSLIRLAMHDLLPPEILTNQRRGLQSSDIIPRMWADAPAVEKALQSFDRDEMVKSYIDLPRISAAWKIIKNGSIETLSLTHANFVLSGIRNGLFLQTYFPNGT